MYIHCTEKKGDLEFVTLDQSFKMIRAKDWYGTTMLPGSRAPICVLSVERNSSP